MKKKSARLVLQRAVLQVRYDVEHRHEVTCAVGGSHLADLVEAFLGYLEAK